MPSIASHFIVANKVGNMLNINNDEYMLGNILPDIINDNNSHYKEKGSYCLIPNIELYIENNTFDQYIFLGYLTHLLLDKYFLEFYVPKNIKNYDKINLFSPNMIYNDYTNMNFYLVNRYQLNLNCINNFMKTNKFDLNNDKYKLNIDSINNKKMGEVKYINLNTFCEFMDFVSLKIAADIKERFLKDD